MANIFQSFTHKMATKKTSWHRYGSKLRHCHAVYDGVVRSRQFRVRRRCVHDGDVVTSERATDWVPRATAGVVSLASLLSTGHARDRPRHSCRHTDTYSDVQRRLTTAVGNVRPTATVSRRQSAGAPLSSSSAAAIQVTHLSARVQLLHQLTT